MLNYKDGLKSNPLKVLEQRNMSSWKKQKSEILKARQNRQPIAGVKMERVR